jgi:hemerythrin superfamily protein
LPFGRGFDQRWKRRPETAAARPTFTEHVIQPKGSKSMIREMLGIAEGILQDLHNDHNEVASLLDRMMVCEDRAERERLFKEMKSKLLAHAHAEQEILYRRLEASAEEQPRVFAHEGTNEHQIVEKHLQKMSAAGDPLSEEWTAELKVLQDLVDHHVDEEESTGFSCARNDFSKEELEEMGQRFQQRKKELMMQAA